MSVQRFVGTKSWSAVRFFLSSKNTLESTKGVASRWRRPPDLRTTGHDREYPLRIGDSISSTLHTTAAKGRNKARAKGPSDEQFQTTRPPPPVPSHTNVATVLAHRCVLGVKVNHDVLLALERRESDLGAVLVFHCKRWCIRTNLSCVRCKMAMRTTVRTGRGLRRCSFPC